MIKSALLNTPMRRFTCVLVLLTFLSLGFVNYNSRQEAINSGNKCLMQSYDVNAALKLKKWELAVTDNAFVRYKKTYSNGRQEYFSFNLRRFSDISYLGDVNAGLLQLKTLADDIIVQTYNDPRGNVDSMAAIMEIPVRGMGPERLDSLRSALMYLKIK